MHARMMSRQHYLTTSTTFIFCLLLGTLSASIEEGAVFWVAPSLEQCGRGTAATAKEQCNTLEGYQKNSSIFSTSHSTWIFLKGEYHIVDSPIIVSGVTNITWTGEEACALSMVRCAIFIPAEISSTVVAVTYNYLEDLISCVEISNPRGMWVIKNLSSPKHLLQ